LINDEILARVWRIEKRAFAWMSLTSTKGVDVGSFDLVILKAMPSK
jgi:hypothetical protein